MALVPGGDYQFDLFRRERHSTPSELTLTTAMVFTVPVGINSLLAMMGSGGNCQVSR
jgi:hypothetical protein